MRIFQLASIFFTLCCIPSNCLAIDSEQLAIVQDSDGFTNIRKAPSTKSKIIGKVKHGAVVWVYSSTGKNWLNIAFYDAKGMERSGFIHRSRVTSTDSFKKLTQVVSKNANVSVYSADDLKVRFTIENFKKDIAKITYTKTEDGHTYPTKINGYTIWGVDGDLPKMQYASIEITQNKTKYSLPKDALGGLYEPSFHKDNIKVFYDSKNKALYITAFNSDGAGSYAVGLRIVNGKYKDRFVISPF